MSLVDEQTVASLAPPREPYVGPLYDPSPVSRDLRNLGGPNPEVANRFAAQQGRYLSGLGETPMQPTVVERVAEQAEHAEVYELEQQDDVLGSGIFDPHRRPGTSNTNTGVFASDYSLPGNVAREVPFTVSRDVTDLTSDADVVIVPGGGLAYVEAGGKGAPFYQTGPKPPPPPIGPAPLTTRDEPYADLSARPTQGWDADSLLDQADYPNWPEPAAPAPQLANQAPATADPAAQSAAALGVAPTVWQPAGPAAELGVPPPSYLPPATWPSHPARQPFYQVAPVPGAPAAQLVPRAPAAQPVRRQSEVWPRGPALALGQNQPAAPSWVPYAVAGVVAGAVLRVVAGALGRA